MVFYLNSDFISEIESNNKLAISALDLLAFGRKHGKIILTASRENLNYLRDCENVSDITRAVFTHLFENHPTNAMIIQKVTFYVKITAGLEHMELVENATSSILELSFDFIQDIDIVNGTMVVAENQSEIEFYKVICHSYKNNRDLDFLQIYYHPQMGGGQTISTVYHNFQRDRKHFCLCLADSDKKYPEANVGSTLRALNEVDDPNNRKHPA